MNVLAINELINLAAAAANAASTFYDAFEASKHTLSENDIAKLRVELAQSTARMNAASAAFDEAVQARHGGH